MQFERITRYHRYCKSLIAFFQFVIYYMTGNITNAGALICIALQKTNVKFVCSRQMIMKLFSQPYNTQTNSALQTLRGG